MSEHAEAVRLNITQIDSKLGLPGPTGMAIIDNAHFSGWMSKCPLLFFPEKRFLPPELPEGIRDMFVPEQMFIIVPENVDLLFEDAKKVGVIPERALLRTAIAGVWRKIEFLQEYKVNRIWADTPTSYNALCLSPHEIFGCQPVAILSEDQIEDLYLQEFEGYMSESLDQRTQEVGHNKAVWFCLRDTECRIISIVAAVMPDESKMYEFLRKAKELSFSKAPNAGLG